MRRGALVRLVAIGLGAGAVALATALFVPWLPTPASRQAGRIDFIFWFVSVICIGIFALVAAVILYAIVRFRARLDDDTDGVPHHGKTRLEIVWTAVPAALVTAIAVVSAVALAQNDSLPRNHMTVGVTAQQFAWSFKYPHLKNLTSPDLRLIVNEPTQLRLRALDVVHSFWVPEFRQKQDAVPGITTRVVVTPTKIGTYPLICTELCGLGHAVMRTRAIVMTRAGFAAWAKAQQKALSGGGGGAGAAVFQQNGCGGCHKFKPAGSSGVTGPDLDKLATYARQAHQPLDKFIHQSIVDPGAYVQPGYANLMPKTFSQLPKDQLAALVKYLKAGAK